MQPFGATMAYYFTGPARPGTTSMAIRPNTRDLFIAAADGDGTGATIYHAEAFGPGMAPRTAG